MGWTYHDLVDVRPWYLTEMYSGAPSLAKLEQARRVLVVRAKPFAATAFRSYVEMRYRRTAPASCGWIMIGCRFRLPAKPVGCRGMQWKYYFQRSGYVAQMPRAMYDLDGMRANKATGYYYRVSPLWRTWDYRKWIVIDPAAMTRPVTVEPPVAFAVASYWLWALQVGYLT